MSGNFASHFRTAIPAFAIRMCRQYTKSWRRCLRPTKTLAQSPKPNSLNKMSSPTYYIGSEAVRHINCKFTPQFVDARKAAPLSLPSVFKCQDDHQFFTVWKPMVVIPQYGPIFSNKILHSKPQTVDINYKTQIQKVFTQNPKLQVAYIPQYRALRRRLERVLVWGPRC